MSNITSAAQSWYMDGPIKFDHTTVIVLLLLAVVLTITTIVTGIMLYTLQCVWYFTGRHEEKRVYYTWKHGESTVNLLSSAAYVLRANASIAELVANGIINPYEYYDTDSRGSPLKFFRRCGCCCAFQQFRSVRAPIAVFRTLPGYPDFNPVSVQRQELEKQCNTAIDLYSCFCAILGTRLHILLIYMCQSVLSYYDGKLYARSNDRHWSPACVSWQGYYQRNLFTVAGYYG